MPAIQGNLKPILAPIAGAADDTITVSQSRYIAAAYTVAGLAVGSVVARSRQAADKPPIAKVFF